jgi:hypothetical protein
MRTWARIGGYRPPLGDSRSVQQTLNDIAAFVRVAQFESFSRAAHALGMPVSTVSRKVTALEERLGVTPRLGGSPRPMAFRLG